MKNIDKIAQDEDRVSLETEVTESFIDGDDSNVISEDLNSSLEVS